MVKKKNGIMPVDCKTCKRRFDKKTCNEQRQKQYQNDWLIINTEMELMQARHKTRKLKCSMPCPQYLSKSKPLRIKDSAYIIQNPVYLQSEFEDRIYNICAEIFEHYSQETDEPLNEVDEVFSEVADQCTTEFLDLMYYKWVDEKYEEKMQELDVNEKE